jgi:hypothetical protein
MDRSDNGRRSSATPKYTLPVFIRLITDWILQVAITDHMSAETARGAASASSLIFRSYRYFAQLS